MENIIKPRGLTPFFEWCQALFCLNVLVVEEIYVFIDNLPSFREGKYLVTEDTFGFQNRREILCRVNKYCKYEWLPTTGNINKGLESRNKCDFQGLSLCDY